jgi:hypothetical protein
MTSSRAPIVSLIFYSLTRTLSSIVLLGQLNRSVFGLPWRRLARTRTVFSSHRSRLREVRGQSYPRSSLLGGPGFRSLCVMQGRLQSVICKISARTALSKSAGSNGRRASLAPASGPIPRHPSCGGKHGGWKWRSFGAPTALGGVTATVVAQEHPSPRDMVALRLIWMQLPIFIEHAWGLAWVRYRAGSRDWILAVSASTASTAMVKGNDAQQ